MTNIETDVINTLFDISEKKGIDYCISIVLNRYILDYDWQITDMYLQYAIKKCTNQNMRDIINNISYSLFFADKDVKQLCLEILKTKNL